MGVSAISSVTSTGVMDNNAGCAPGHGGPDCSLQLETLQAAPQMDEEFLDPLGGGRALKGMGETDADATPASAVPSQLRKMLLYAQHLEATRGEGQDVQVAPPHPLGPLLLAPCSPACSTAADCPLRADVRQILDEQSSPKDSPLGAQEHPYSARVGHAHPLQLSIGVSVRSMWIAPCAWPYPRTGLQSADGGSVTLPGVGWWVSASAGRPRHCVRHRHRLRFLRRLL